MRYARVLVRRRALPIAAVATAFVMTGCGSSTPAVIAVQPADARVFAGQTAAFEVRAEDPDGVTYQWSRNGQVIPGATGARHVTASTTLEDDGASYTVAVTRDGDGMNSRAARLTVDPPLDLRFKWADAPYQPEWSGSGSILGSSGMGEQLVYEGVGTPLAGGGCSTPSGASTWYFGLSTARNGMTTTYETSLLDSLSVGWPAALGPDAVVTALDLQQACGLYGASISRTTQAGAFAPAIDASIPAADLQAVATSEGAAGRVLTAISYRGGLVSYVSYGWSLAPSAVYEARVVTTSFDGLAAAAWSLAAEGYVLTAAGSGDAGASGFVLVGTRLQGQTRERSLMLGGYLSQYRSHGIMAILEDFASPRGLIIGEH